MAPPKAGGASLSKATYVTLTKEGKPVYEPGLRAEIVGRRQPKQRRKDDVEEPPVSCDLKEVLALPPAARVGWLEKALSAIPKGKVKAQEVFDIITHRKCPLEVTDEIGQQMLKLVKESVMFFTEKQQLSLAKCQLVRDFKPGGGGARSNKAQREGSSDRSSADDSPPRRRPEATHRAQSPPRRRSFQESDDRPREHDRGRAHPPLPPESLPVLASGSAAAASSSRPSSGPMPTAPQRVAKPAGSGTGAAPLGAGGQQPPLPSIPGQPAEPASVGPAVSEEWMRMEYARLEKEREKKRQQDLRVIEEQKKKRQERENMRKAKIGNAFMLAGEDDEDEDAAGGSGGRPLVERRAEDRLKVMDEGRAFSGGIGYATPASGSATAAAGALAKPGGDGVVSEARTILQKGAGSFMQAGKRRSRSARRRRSPSTSRSRSRRGRRDRGDRDRGERDRDRGATTTTTARRDRTWDSLRSPTPDGHLRGQMRNARKAKLMQQMLAQGNVPRIA